MPPALRAKTVITLVVSKEGMVAKSFRWTLEAGKFPKAVIS